MLLPTEAQDAAQSTIHAMLAERQRSLNSAIDEIVHSHVRRSTFPSSMFLTDVRDACLSEVDFRAGYAWDRLRQALTYARFVPDSGFVDDVRAFFSQFRNSVIADVKETFANEQKRASGISMDPGIDSRWEEAEQRVVGEAKMEYLRVTGDQQPATPMNVTFHGPGILQHGSGNIASQVVSDVDLGQLQSILDELEIAIRDKTIPEPARRDISAVAHDAKAELSKRKPNAMATLQLMASMAPLIEQVPKLKPVWESIAGFLRAHGLPLP